MFLKKIAAQRTARPSNRGSHPPAPQPTSREAVRSNVARTRPAPAAHRPSPQPLRAGPAQLFIVSDPSRTPAHTHAPGSSSPSSIHRAKPPRGPLGNRTRAKTPENPTAAFSIPSVVRVSLQGDSDLAVELEPPSSSLLVSVTVRARPAAPLFPLGTPLEPALV